MKAKKIFVIIIAVITVLNLAGFIGLYCKMSAISDKLNSTEYVLFVGLNDKDTRKQEISDDEAIATIKRVLKKYIDGYSLVNAQGALIDDSGYEINENTIVCYVNGVNEKTIHSIADELIEVLNQESILIKKNLTSSEYYKGKAD